MRALFAAAFALAVLAAPAVAQERPVIVADSYPVAWFAERLAGDAADVRLPVPEGRDPAFWRPSIAEIAAIQSADLIALNGSGLADWTGRASLPRSRTVDTGRGLADELIATEIVTHSHGGEGEHSHEGVATYTWLDFGLAARQAEALAAPMRRAVPDADVDANLGALLGDLADLDALGDALPEGVAAIASHPRYQYLSRAYGLDIASLDWGVGETPDAARIATLRALRGRDGRARLHLGGGAHGRSARRGGCAGAWPRPSCRRWPCPPRKATSSPPCARVSPRSRKHSKRDPDRASPGSLRGHIRFGSHPRGAGGARRSRIPMRAAARSLPAMRSVRSWTRPKSTTAF